MAVFYEHCTLKELILMFSPQCMVCRDQTPSSVQVLVAAAPTQPSRHLYTASPPREVTSLEPGGSPGTPHSAASRQPGTSSSGSSGTSSNIVAVRCSRRASENVDMKSVSLHDAHPVIWDHNCQVCNSLLGFKRHN